MQNWKREKSPSSEIQSIYKSGFGIWQSIEAILLPSLFRNSGLSSNNHLIFYLRETDVDLSPFCLLIDMLDVTYCRFT